MALILCVSSHKSMASDNLHQFNSYMDQLIYEETYGECKNLKSKLTSVFNKNTNRAMLISVGQSLSFILPFVGSKNEEHKYLKNGLISDYVLDRLNSTGYMYAIQDCFKNRPDLQRNYTLSMMIADFLGKAPAVVFIMYEHKVFHKVFETISHKYPVLTKILLGVGASAIVASLAKRIYEEDLKRSLNDDERKRIEYLAEDLDENLNDSAEQVLAFSEEVIISLERILKEEVDKGRKEKISKRIKELREKHADLIKDIKKSKEKNFIIYYEGNFGWR